MFQLLVADRTLMTSLLPEKEKTNAKGLDQDRFAGGWPVQ